MKIEQTIETPEGTVEIKGSLDAKELNFVVNVGLNYLLQQGAIPFVMKSDEENEETIVHEGSETVQ